MGSASSQLDRGYQRDIFSIGGVCLLLDGILSMIVLSILLTKPESGSSDALRQIFEQNLFYRTTIGVHILVAVLSAPGFLALYLYLKENKRTHMLLTTVFFLTSIVLLLISDVMQYAIVGLSARYVAAANEVERAGYVGAFMLGVEASTAAETLADYLFSVSLLVLASVMMNARWGKTVHLSAVTGVLGLVGIVFAHSAFGVGVGYLFNYLAAFWYLATGHRLYRLSRASS